MTATPTIALPNGQPREQLPTLPSAIVDSDKTETILRTLRHFHLGNPQASTQLEAVSEELLPALLEPFRDANTLRYDYPLFLFPADIDNVDHSVEALARPLSDYLQSLLNNFAPSAEAARILKDNIPWIERALREALRDQEGPVDAAAQLQTTTTALQSHLKLNQENRERLQADIDRMLAALPEGGQLLAYGRYPAIHLLIHAIRCRVIPRHRLFRRTIENQIKALDNLLAIDWSKSAASQTPAHIQSSVGPSSARFDVGALSRVMDHSQGSVGLSRGRKSRIEKALATLRDYQDRENLIHFIHTERLETGDWLQAIDGFRALSSDSPCRRATELFDEQAAELASVFAAVRIAELELTNRYDPTIHDPWFDNFDWQAFSRDELLLVPAVIALEAANRVAGAEMPALTQLLNSGRPVQVLVRVLAHNNPGAQPDQPLLQSYRSELGFLGIAQRQAVVSQTSAARHQNMLEAFNTALDATRTSLHLINIGLRPTGKASLLNAWLVAGAALEGRVHPFFSVNPAQGDAFAERMHFDGNPQPERDWPIHPFCYRDANGERVETELGFTFADYALLIPRLHKQFARIPAECHADDLITVEQFLALERSEQERHIPFIWAVDANAALLRLAVSRSLIEACRDRLNFWHTLQELAGINNRYVDQALEQQRGTLQAEAETRLEQAKAVYEAELLRVRNETAGEVMGRLTDMLLNVDLSVARQRPLTRATPVAGNIGTASAAGETQVSEPVAEPPAPPQGDHPGTAESEMEPWIDTPLCTSCNDCLVINPQLFVYDETKQAYLGDLATGSYAQLVEAAEICPSKCIHPGTPWNSNEAGLEALIARATPFN